MLRGDKRLMWLGALLMGLSLVLAGGVAYAQEVPASDADADGIADAVDNCPLIANADQLDTDGDKIGDACDPDQNLSGLLKMIIDAFQAKNWGLFASLIIMLLMWVVGKFLKVDNSWLPLLSAGTGMVAAVALGFASGVEWYTALFNGLLVGMAASGFWSVLGKKILPTDSK